MKVLVTGSNGFVGKNLVQYLEAKKLYKIHAPKRQELNLLDSAAVQAYLEKHRFDVVIHCAITILSLEDNLRMYYHIEHCSSLYGKMLNIGSGSEYDDAHYIPQMDESYFGKHLPSSNYGLSKYIIGKDIESNHRNIYNLRVFGIFGKFEDYRRRFISNNICRALCNLPISINQNMYFDYLYIIDFCRNIDLLLDKDLEHRSYNFCSGTRIDLLSIAQIIQQIEGNSLPIIVKQPGFKPEYTGNNDRICREVQEIAFTPMEQAVMELFDFYRSGEVSFHVSDFA